LEEKVFVQHPDAPVACPTRRDLPPTVVNRTGGDALV
jgi:hypothetical protein